MKICFYFQVHQPWRLRPYSFFDIGRNVSYQDEQKNGDILRKVASKCYLPVNQIMLDLIQQYRGEFKISYSVTGTVIEQFKRYSPETLDSFKRLADTGCVEFLNETYHHSLSALFSEEIFREEVLRHRDLIKQEFGQTPVIFRNTELIYNNHIANMVASLGYRGILAEGAEKVLGGRSPNYVYQATYPNHLESPVSVIASVSEAIQEDRAVFLDCFADARNDGSNDNPQILSGLGVHSDLKILLRNYPLSDDIAFRFSNPHWEEYPLTADKFSVWLHSQAAVGDVVNLFMDYETFGEHQWESTGIFNFLRSLPEAVLKHPDFSFCTPSEAIDSLSPVSTLDIPEALSWADIERDLTAWRGNPLQEDALQAIYQLEGAVRACDDIHIKKDFYRLLTSDHFYYMCTKWHADGDVHKYFNPYQDPYRAYTNFQSVVKDLKLRLGRIQCL